MSYLVLSLLVATSTLRGPPSEAELVQEIKAAKACFESGRFECARDHYESVLAGVSDAGQRDKVHSWLGEIYERLDDFERAVKHLRAIKNRNARDETRLVLLEKRMAEAPAVTIIVEDAARRPVDAQIAIAGRSGRSPLSVTLDPGDYDLVIQALGYETVRERVAVTKGRQQTLTRTVRPRVDPVVVTRTGGGALGAIQVFVDDVPVGHSGVTAELVGLAPGPHRVVCLHPDGFREAIAVVVDPTRQLTVGCGHDAGSGDSVGRPVFWTTLGIGLAAAVTGVTLLGLHYGTEANLAPGESSSVPHPAVGWSLLGAGVTASGLSAIAY